MRKLRGTALNNDLHAMDAKTSDDRNENQTEQFRTDPYKPLIDLAATHTVPKPLDNNKMKQFETIHR